MNVFAESDERLRRTDGRLRSEALMRLRATPNGNVQHGSAKPWSVRATCESHGRGRPC
eukprot:CAMPEP_0204157910 /NCGR_PEP_ID=MMETSP0361-20130328/31646_1 /ASSEMBLY_ACC=CAM_ASM_000343 /TAXON_ID=268821 /ORGANISM="Scrippsiella Hangoei, Strain SHTV-5" /LENGTH=57 /DNA_ID=CAMNT_0051113755 /DNA_START=66 /DNA_END=236 /DNA_ORIENTATION=+